MKSDNERERAQLERLENGEETELALVLVEVVARDEKGRISQFRGMRDASIADMRIYGPTEF